MNGEDRVGARRLDISVTGYQRGPVYFETANGNFQLNLDRVRVVLAEEVYTDLAETGESALDQSRVYETLVERAGEVIRPELQTGGDQIRSPAGHEYDPETLVRAALSEPHLQNEIALEAGVFIPALLEEEDVPVETRTDGDSYLYTTRPGSGPESATDMDLGWEALKLDGTADMLPEEGGHIPAGWTASGEWVPPVQVNPADTYREGGQDRPGEDRRNRRTEDDRRPAGERATMDPDRNDGYRS